MSSVEYLSIVSSPFFTVAAESQDVSNEARGWLDSALVVRAVRGQKCKTLESLFDEFAAAFQFPCYFGENWAAFRDCITDLGWLPFRPGIVVLIYGAEQVLQEAHPAELATLVATFASAADEFAEVVADGEWWDRAPVPFHVVLQSESADDLERWRSSGADVTSLELL
jgi:RNAse (barnase) inhibitor barstar